MEEASQNHPQPWPRLRSEPGPDLIIFRARFDTFRNPRNAAELQRLVLETPDWCNVVALTPERHLVVIRQFRFGTGAISFEIPGGTVDPGEDSGQAARRELLEETGYTAPSWTYLGASEPNPAFHDNLCHHWLAQDARPTHSPQLDHGEDIAIGTLLLEEVRRAVASGDLRHSLAVVALSKVLDLRQ